MFEMIMLLVLMIAMFALAHHDSQCHRCAGSGRFSEKEGKCRRCDGSGLSS